ncbi:MAG: hypothetical protein LBK02_04515 [Treponema sp.]|jgi:hypothetical protein|nr:hypothetical protein [Treponema sp.]
MKTLYSVLQFGIFIQCRGFPDPAYTGAANAGNREDAPYNNGKSFLRHVYCHLEDIIYIFRKRLVFLLSKHFYLHQPLKSLLKTFVSPEQAPGGLVY